MFWCVRSPLLVALCMAALSTAVPAAAQDSRITPELGAVTLSLHGTDIVITRSGAACPQSCVQPHSAAAGIDTLGELELIDFLTGSAADGTGLLIDTRAPEQFSAETLPGAVNVPELTLRSDNPYRDDLLGALGATAGDFSTAYTLVLFAQDAGDPRAVDGLRALLIAGYPAEKLRFYRAGVSGWTALGLSSTQGEG